jgi:hypothetical protein
MILVLDFSHMKILNENIYSSLVIILIISKLLVNHSFAMGTGPQLVVVLGLLMGIPSTVGCRPQLVVVFGFSMGIPLMMGFRPQLVVVSGLSVGIPLTVDLGHNLFSSAFRWESL